MKKFITILISCSLALAAGAMAQQDEEQQPTPKKQAEKGKAHPGKGVKPAPNPQSAPKPQAGAKVREKESGNAVNANANGNAPAEMHKKGRNAAQPSATANEAASSAPAAAQANKPNSQANKQAAQTKKPDVQAIKAQHANFHAQPKPEQAPAVMFNQSRRIEGSDHWQGEKYTVFRSYRPEMHDQAFYRSRYSRVELIGGGYYYFNAGYWYPAWGYNPSSSYYAYDGPIYAGHRAEPPDRVIADVQASLQAQGYYKGEVDGLLGPLTREALTGYQSNNGLYATAAIDEPTLASLGMD